MFMNRKTRGWRRLCWGTLLALAVSQPAMAERVKDLASVAGVRHNQLVGYGLVVGLDGSGDQTSQTPFTVQSLKNMLTQFGITVPPGVNLQLKNVAAVSIQAVMRSLLGLFEFVCPLPHDLLELMGDLVFLGIDDDALAPGVPGGAGLFGDGFEPLDRFVVACLGIGAEALGQGNDRDRLLDVIEDAERVVEGEIEIRQAAIVSSARLRV